MAVVALLLIGRGTDHARIRTLQGELRTASAALKQAADDVRRFSVREGQAATVAATRCQAEGSTAFQRGRAFGRAETCVAQ